MIIKLLSFLFLASAVFFLVLFHDQTKNDSRDFISCHPHLTFLHPYIGCDRSSKITRLLQFGDRRARTMAALALIKSPNDADSSKLNVILRHFLHNGTEEADLSLLLYTLIKSTDGRPDLSTYISRREDIVAILQRIFSFSHYSWYSSTMAFLHQLAAGSIVPTDFNELNRHGMWDFMLQKLEISSNDERVYIMSLLLVWSQKTAFIQSLDVLKRRKLNEVLKELSSSSVADVLHLAEECNRQLAISVNKLDSEATEAAKVAQAAEGDPHHLVDDHFATEKARDEDTLKTPSEPNASERLSESFVFVEESESTIAPTETSSEESDQAGSIALSKDKRKKVLKRRKASAIKIDL